MHLSVPKNRSQTSSNVTAQCIACNSGLRCDSCIHHTVLKLLNGSNWFMKWKLTNYSSSKSKNSISLSSDTVSVTVEFLVKTEVVQFHRMHNWSGQFVCHICTVSTCKRHLLLVCVCVCVVFSPLLRLSPPPSEKDYYFNLDENEGVCDLFDIPLWYVRQHASHCLYTSLP